ncbi:MAG: hypothetical protein MUC58_09680 [Rhizobiaceae bacterium]|jgi:hypothetical protein|nr:hypothetical protein [Rhizobiaceae bacterium]
MTRAARRGLFVGLALIIVLSLSPVLAALTASAIASSAGCVLTGAGPEPCLIGGVDWGVALSAKFTAHWFAFLTLAAGAIALVVWLFVALILWWRGRSV